MSKDRRLDDDLETFLRKGHGRCQHCGAHPETQQGHTDTCPLNPKEH